MYEKRPCTFFVVVPHKPGMWFAEHTLHVFIPRLGGQRKTLFFIAIFYCRWSRILFACTENQKFVIRWSV